MRYGKAEAVKSCDAPHDVWALGVVVYQLFTACDADDELPFGPMTKDYEALAQMDPSLRTAAVRAAIAAEQDQWV